MQQKQPKPKQFDIYVDEIIMPREWASFTTPPTPWLLPGRYTVKREFDEDRYLVRIAERTLTILDKKICRLA